MRTLFASFFLNFLDMYLPLQVPVWYDNPSGPPTFVSRTECHITCLRLSSGKIIM